MIEYFDTDATSPTDVKNAVAQAVSEFGKIDILVSNATYLPALALFADAPLDDYWRAFEVNVKSGITVAQEILKITSSNAAIINITAGIARVHHNSFPGILAYSASKLTVLSIVNFIQT